MGDPAQIKKEIHALLDKVKADLDELRVKNAMLLEKLQARGTT
jgi:hypothetical protein